MPKQQSSLDSFFGTGAKLKKQKTLSSFFNKDKENTRNNDGAEKDNNEKPSDAQTHEEKKNTAVSMRETKRRAIVDEDSEDEGITSGTGATTATGTDSKPQAPSIDEQAKLPSTSTSSSELDEDSKKNATTAEKASSPVNTAGAASKDLLKLQLQAKKFAKLAEVSATDKLDPISSPVMYQDLVKVLEQVEATSGRLEIQALMTTFFRRLLQSSPDDLYHVVYLASSSIAPAYKCLELGIGDSILMKAIGEACGTKAANVKEKYEEEGDLGDVAKAFKSKQRTLSFGIKPKPLTAKQVLQTFREIANISGSQSQKLKVNLIKKMLVAAQQASETKYIIRGLQGKLRIGLASSTVLVSLAHALAFSVPSTVDASFATSQQNSSDENVNKYRDESAPIEKRLEAAVNIVKQVYSEVPSYDALLDAALKVPLVSLHDACAFQPGIPVVPMLAKPTKSIQEVLNRLNGLAFTCEYKYDGERAQIHMTPDGQLKVFSRNLLETTSKYPEVPLFVQEAAGANSDVKSFVLDAEVVAYNSQLDKLVPFQILSTRKKTEESAETAKVQVIVQAFDLMYLNGQSLLTKPLEQRRHLMKKHFHPVQGKFQYAKALDFVEDGDTTALEQFLDAAVNGQCEGLMVKTMEDVYEPSRRSLNWLKLKKDYLDGLGDSFDLVPLGAYFGRGKRTGVYGAYLLACYDEDTEEFQSVCKIGTGFSDEDLQSLAASLNQHKIDSKSAQYNVSDSMECDVWFDAVQVWEVKAADLSKSSTHKGAVGKTGEAGRGIGLRFPRFERVRDDKTPDLATSSDQVLDIYYNQDTVKGQDDGDDDNDDEGI